MIQQRRRPVTGFHQHPFKVTYSRCTRVCNTYTVVAIVFFFFLLCSLHFLSRLPQRSLPRLRIAHAIVTIVPSSHFRRHNASVSRLSDRKINLMQQAVIFRTRMWSKRPKMRVNRARTHTRMHAYYNVLYEPCTRFTRVRRTRFHCTRVLYALIFLHTHASTRYTRC